MGIKKPTPANVHTARLKYYFKPWFVFFLSEMCLGTCKYNTNIVICSCSGNFLVLKLISDD